MSSQSSKRKGHVVERWEKELLEVFDGQLERKLVIEDQGFTTLDPKSLTRELKSTKKLTLRAPQQGTTNETITLIKFDPNFMSPNEIRCRSHSCKKTKKRQPSSKPSKEDLYLCPRHRKIVDDYVTKKCAEKGIDVNKEYSPEDFDGYTSLIGLLESAYNLFVKRPAGSESVLKGKPAILGEVFINLRNFLIITNALLNPDVGNLLTALMRPMEVFMAILKMLREDGENIVGSLERLVDLLRYVIQDILYAFGVIYSWVHLALLGNPGAQIGAGIGGLAGILGLAVNPVVGLLAMAGGALFGGLTGSGIYNLQKERREQREADEALRRFQEYHEQMRGQEDLDEGQLDEPADTALFYITGSEHGDLTLAILFVFQVFSPLFLGI